MRVLVKILLVFFVLSLVGGVVYSFLNQISSISLNRSPDESVSEESVVTQVAAIEQESPLTREVNSANGKLTLIMEENRQQDSADYSFFVGNNTDGSRNLVFQKTLIADSHFDLPLNTWSPDNNYFFIKENTQVRVNYFVFRADGLPVVKDMQYIDIVADFSSREKDLVVTKVTGWASNTLLYLLTENSSGGQGPTYWFEVPTSATIRLSGS